MYKLRTEFNKSGNIVFSKMKQNKQNVYLAKDELGNERPVTKDWILVNQREIVNLKVLAGDRLQPYKVVPNVNFHKLDERYDEAYKYLWDNGKVDGYYEALDAGDVFLRKQKEFVGQYCRYRQDIFSSDREVVALIFALNGMEC